MFLRLHILCSEKSTLISSNSKRYFFSVHNPQKHVAQVGWVRWRADWVRDSRVGQLSDYGLRFVAMVSDKESISSASVLGAIE